MWIARDKDGTICVYKDEPKYDIYEGEWYADDADLGEVVTNFPLYDEEFPEVTCENSPVEITYLGQLANASVDSNICADCEAPLHDKNACKKCQFGASCAK
jgi:hypothetical protein